MKYLFYIWLFLVFASVGIGNIYADDSAIGVFTVTPTSSTFNTPLNSTSPSLIPITTVDNYLEVETIIWLKIIFGGIMFQSGLITALIMAVRFKLK